MFDEVNLVNILEKLEYQNVELAEFDEQYDDKRRRYESIYVRVEN